MACRGGPKTTGASKPRSDGMYSVAQCSQLTWWTNGRKLVRSLLGDIPCSLLCKLLRGAIPDGTGHRIVRLELLAVIVGDGVPVVFSVDLVGLLCCGDVEVTNGGE